MAELIKMMTWRNSPRVLLIGMVLILAILASITGCTSANAYDAGHFDTLVLQAVAADGLSSEVPSPSPEPSRCGGDGYIEHGDGHRTPCPGCQDCAKAVIPEPQPLDELSQEKLVGWRPGTWFDGSFRTKRGWVRGKRCMWGGKKWGHHNGVTYELDDDFNVKERVLTQCRPDGSCPATGGLSYSQSPARRLFRGGFLRGRCGAGGCR